MTTEYKPPYVARLGEGFLKPCKFSDGKVHKIKYHYVDVYEVNEDSETKIGTYEVSDFKSPRVVFHPFRHDGEWYALVSESKKIFVYSLPEMKLLAELEPQGCIKFLEFYIPRFHHVVYKGVAFTLVDKEIEEDYKDNEAWCHADFAFVMGYDPFCNSPNYVNIVDLSNIKIGEIKFKQEYWHECPQWLDLNQIVQISYWDKSFPAFAIATVEYASTSTGLKCGNNGWTDETLGAIDSGEKS